MNDLLTRLVQQLEESAAAEWLEALGRLVGHAAAALLDSDDFKDSHPIITAIYSLLKKGS
jgi:hypothetical protein